jgi:hypothetical protein
MMKKKKEVERIIYLNSKERKKRKKLYSCPIK